MKPRKTESNLSVMLIALLIALLLQIMPLDPDAAVWRPQFVLLLLTFFLLYRPLHYGITSAWLVGILLDLVYGGVMGRYALALGVCAYLLNLLRRRLTHAHLWHQCGLVLLLVAASQLIVVSVNLLTNSGASWVLVWYPAISSALIWPLVYLAMSWAIVRRK